MQKKTKSYKQLYEETKFMLEKYQDEIVPQLQQDLEAAIEDIKCPSVCACCAKPCKGEDLDCIDNGYLNFTWKRDRRWRNIVSQPPENQ